MFAKIIFCRHDSTAALQGPRLSISNTTKQTPDSEYDGRQRQEKKNRRQQQSHAFSHMTGALL